LLDLAMFLKLDDGDDMVSDLLPVRGQRFLSRQLAGLGITVDPEEKNSW